MIKAHVAASEMRSWLKDPLATPGDYMIVGYLDLRAIEVRPNLDLRRTLQDLTEG